MKRECLLIFYKYPHLVKQLKLLCFAYIIIFIKIIVLTGNYYTFISYANFAPK